MDSHLDRDLNAVDWLKRLEAKASELRACGKSKITGGNDGEPVLARWEYNGFSVVHRPKDEHGILRISVGGGETPVLCNYLVFRGDHAQCVDLLRKALAALENPTG